MTRRSPVPEEVHAQRQAPVAGPLGVAVAYAGLGDADAAFAWLDRAVAERALFVSGIQTMPAFEPLHRDPRWTPLLRRIGLAAR